MSLKIKLIELLNSIAYLLEIKGENQFKISAYKKGADALKQVDNIEEVIKNDDLQNIKGIGKGLQSVIKEYYEKGFSSDYQNLAAEIPPVIIELNKIRGLGIKKINLLLNAFEIHSLQDLKDICKSDKILEVKGFTEKTRDMILLEIERIENSAGYILMNQAESYIDLVSKYISRFNYINNFEISGESIRNLEIISKLEFIGMTENIKELYKELEFSTNIESSIIENFHLDIFENNISSFEIQNYSTIPVYLYIAENQSDFIKLKFIKSSSEEFLNNFDLMKLQLKSVDSENEIFHMFNFDYIIPEMREGQFFSLSKNLKKNSALTIKDFQGLLHFHTVASDGKNSLAEMADEAVNSGFKYIAVCDHSQSAFYANGLNQNDIINQKNEIKELNKTSEIKIFQGIEVDILQSGDLDYTEDFLDIFDFIVASVHSRFKMDEEEMTQRIIKAIENPYTDVLGHPTGRLLLERSAYKLNIKKVIDACSQNSVAIEINANPHRLDLDWRNIFYAREKGCLFSINPDAHTIKGISEIKFGIKIARKGGISPEEIINCMDLNNFKIFLNRKVKRNIQ